MKFTEEAMPNWESEIKTRFRFLACSTVSATNSVYHFWSDENGKVLFSSKAGIITVAQNRILTAETRRIYFLFGGEVPPNKNLFVQGNQHSLALLPSGNTSALFPQGRGF